MNRKSKLLTLTIYYCKVNIRSRWLRLMLSFTHVYQSLLPFCIWSLLNFLNSPKANHLKFMCKVRDHKRKAKDDLSLSHFFRPGDMSLLILVNVPWTHSSIFCGCLPVVIFILKYDGKIVLTLLISIYYRNIIIIIFA